MPHRMERKPKNSQQQKNEAMVGSDQPTTTRKKCHFKRRNKVTNAISPDKIGLFNREKLY